VQSATTLEKRLTDLKAAQAELIRPVKMHGFSIEKVSAITGDKPTRLAYAITYRATCSTRAVSRTDSRHAFNMAARSI
jgi:hypothetical protein